MNDVEAKIWPPIPASCVEVSEGRQYALIRREDGPWCRVRLPQDGTSRMGQPSYTGVTLNSVNEVYREDIDHTCGRRAGRKRDREEREREDAEMAEDMEGLPYQPATDEDISELMSREALEEEDIVSAEEDEGDAIAWRWRELQRLFQGSTAPGVVLVRRGGAGSPVWAAVIVGGNTCDRGRRASGCACTPYVNSHRVSLRREGSRSEMFRAARGKVTTASLGDRRWKCSGFAG